LYIDGFKSFFVCLVSIAKLKRNCYRRSVDQPRKSAFIAVCASILAARKLATVPRNSPGYVAAIAAGVTDARRIVQRIEKESSRRRA
jgi:hypothetical protein